MYPEWVKQHRVKGTSVKRVGDSYYLYKTTSKRVAGKKNPQPSSEYIGRITPEGVVNAKARRLPIGSVRVYEYGFSYALQCLLPKEFISSGCHEQDREGIFLAIVRHYSPESYLLRGKQTQTCEEMHASMSAHIKRFERLTKVSIESLLPLKGVYLVEAGGVEMIAEVRPEHAEMLRKVGVAL